MGFRSQKLFEVVLLVCILIESAIACDGHKLKMNYLKNCGDVKNNVVTIIENSTFILTDDCSIIPTTCLETSGFTTSTVKYQIWKSDLPLLRGEMDCCEMMVKFDNDNKGLLNSFSMPTKCPVKKQKVCSDGTKPANLQKYKKLIWLARGGKIRTELKFTHDTGKSCFLSEFEILKK